MIYAGKRYTSHARGSRVVALECDRCRTHFVYELIREAVGAASAPYYIGQAGAAKRAQKSAAKKLAKRLAEESEPVACPKCHWVNAGVIEGYRRSRFRGLDTVGYIAGPVIALVTVLSKLADTRDFSADWLPAVAIGLGVGGAVAGVLLGLQWALRRTGNLNKAFPNPPRLPSGTPVGRTKEDLDALQPVSDKFTPIDPATADFPDWVIFRSGQLVLPNVCCECLAPPTTQFRAGGTVAVARGIVPPLCAECDSRLKSKRRMLRLQVIAVAAILGGAVYLLGGTDPSDRLAAGIGTAIVVALVGLVVAQSLLVKPFWVKIVDRSRSLYRIRFQSEQYTEMVRKATADQETARFRQTNG